MKLKKQIVVNGVKVPAGTDLTFDQGIAKFNDIDVNLSAIPIDAMEYEMNEVLHPAVWDQKGDDYAIKQGIRENLLGIANDFYAQSGFTAPIEDIILTGSMANYNWHDKSDLDVHVVVDFSKIEGDPEFVKTAANNSKWKWNKEHDITVNGHDVELYIQDANEPHTASGVYSLQNNAWLTKPSFKTVNVDDNAVQAKADAIRLAAQDLTERTGDATDINELQSLLDECQELRYKALHLRKDAFAEGLDEFSTGNLAFKALRNDGTIELLFNLEKELYDRMHSINADEEDSVLKSAMQGFVDKWWKKIEDAMTKNKASQEISKAYHLPLFVVDRICDQIRKADPKRWVKKS